MKNILTRRATYIAIVCFSLATLLPAIVQASQTSTNDLSSVLLAQSLPTPRPPTNSDIAQLTTLIHRVAPGTAYISNIALVGNYAIAYWMNGKYGAGVILATNTSGTWVLIAHDHGALSVSDILHLAPAMGSAAAQALFDQAKIGAP